MIDFHTHILQEVDDGSCDLQTSISMIKNEIKQGVDQIVCTPHYRKGIFETPVEIIKEKFNTLKQAVKNENLPVELFLGMEIFYDDNFFENLDNGRYLTINDTKYILIEFHYNKYTEISEICFKLRVRGYIPIVAHVERYAYLKKIEDYAEIVSCGGKLTVNAEAILGRNGLFEKLHCKKLIQNGLIQMITSDSHHNRKLCFLKAFEYVDRKFEDEVSEFLFYDCANEILHNNV